jgi:hypothetical protein
LLRSALLVRVPKNCAVERMRQLESSQRTAV